ncbi:hypothetical protein [Bdellovibrio sp.]|uniref:hypothetical protein n=1 Tax=Bdellovibrio sp. TaxID=28201 RepID=UPI0039E363AB
MVRSKNSIKAKLKAKFEKFKKLIERKLGKMNWKKLSTTSISIIIIVASTGILGVEAQILAKAIVDIITTIA